MVLPAQFFFFFFNDTATTEIYTLSLHDALPISMRFFVNRTLPIRISMGWSFVSGVLRFLGSHPSMSFLLSVSRLDRKSTRLNSSHANISYAVFCLKKNQYVTCCLLLDNT